MRICNQHLLPFFIAASFAMSTSAFDLNWVGGGPLPPANTEIKVIGQRADGRLIAGTKTGGTYVSNAAKTKWDAQSFGLQGGDGQDVKSLCVVPDATGTILVGTKDGVFRSSNGGLNFSSSSIGLSTTDSRDARYLVAANATTVLLATKGGFFYSTDGGRSWTGNNHGLDTAGRMDAKVVAYDSGSGMTFLGTKSGIFKTSNPLGGTWVLTAPGVVDGSESKAMIFNSDRTSLYLHIKPQGTPSLPDSVYRTDDGGATFESIPIPSSQEVKEFGFSPHPTDPDRILAADKQGNVYVSDNRGILWAPAPGQPGGGEIKAIHRDSADPGNTWYAGTKQGMYKTTNGGASWSAVNEGLVPGAAEAKSIVVDPMNPLQVLVGTKTGLWFTSQGAATVGTGWVEKTQSISTLFNLDIRQVFVDRANDSSGNTIFIAAKFDLFKTTDGGSLWTVASSGFTLPDIGGDLDIKWVVQNPSDPSTFYVSRKVKNSTNEYGEVYRSLDSGISWTKVSVDSVFAGEEGDAKVMAFSGSTLYVGTKSGVFRADVTGNPTPLDFQPANNGILLDHEGGIDIKTMTLSPDGGALVVGTKRGVYLSEDGGDAWTDISGNLPPEKPEEPDRVEVESVHFDPDTGVIWVGTKKHGPWYTQFPVAVNPVWVDFSPGLPGGKTLEAKAIATTPEEGTTRLYYGSKEGTFAINLQSLQPTSSIENWRMYE